MSTTDSEKRTGLLRRTAKEIRNYKVRQKILLTALALLIGFTAVIYGVSALYKKTGSFTVSISKYEMTRYGLSLSESRDLTHQTSHLNARIVEEMTNIAGETIPQNVNMIDGEHNGDNYIAYTFYLQNAGMVEASCDYQVVMSNVTNGLDEAIRLMLFVDDESQVYAKTASDGSGAEPNTEEFYSSTVMARGRIDDLAPEDVVKYTVVIWIEGNDPDCRNWLIGGQLRVEMQINIVH